MNADRDERYLWTVIRERRLTSFFVLAWGVELVPDLTGMTQPSWASWFFAGFLSALAPSVAAAIVVAASGESVRDWVRSVATVRVHPKWYAAAIAVPFLIVYAAGVVSWMTGGPIDWSAYRVRHPLSPIRTCDSLHYV